MSGWVWAWLGMHAGCFALLLVLARTSRICEDERGVAGSGPGETVVAPLPAP